MSSLAFCLILAGDLQVILEFSSVTFLLISFLMAYVNFTIYKKTNSSLILTIMAMVGLFSGILLITYYEVTTQVEQSYFIGGIYLLLILREWLFSRFKKAS